MGDLLADETARHFNGKLYVHDVRLFFTAKGFVGVGPAAMETGDSISILAGGSLPYVLRTVPNAARLNTFELIGSCYVHDVMDGQVVHAIKEDNWHNIYLV